MLRRPDTTTDDAMDGHDAPSQQLEAAKKLHRKTTDHSRRALDVAQETLELAGATAEELQRQTHQLDDVQNQLEEMEEHVEESESLLRYLTRCFVCFSCCDGDPDKLKSKKWRQRTEKMEQKRAKALKAKASKSKPEVEKALERSNTYQKNGREPSEEMKNGFDGEKAAKKVQQSPFKRRRTRTRSKSGSMEDLPEEISDPQRMQTMDDQALMELHGETEKQDKYMDEIARTLGEIKLVGQGMDEELGKQNEKVEGMHDNMDLLNGRIREMNKRSKLKNYK